MPLALHQQTPHKSKYKTNEAQIKVELSVMSSTDKFTQSQAADVETHINTRISWREIKKRGFAITCSFANDEARS